MNNLEKLDNLHLEEDEDVADFSIPHDNSTANIRLKEGFEMQ